MRRTPFAPIAIVLLLVGVLVTACTFRPRGGPSAGRAEAVLHMECGIRLAVPAMSSWIVRRDGDGSLRVLARPT
jgi:hypothetical protein